MRYLKAVMLLGVGATLCVAAPPDVSAADLGVTRTKASGHSHYKRVRVVRDYDGTPVAERQIRSVERLPDGSLVETSRLEMVPLMRAEPRYYLNGEPVLPQRLRSPAVIVLRP